MATIMDNLLECKITNCENKYMHLDYDHVCDKCYNIGHVNGACVATRDYNVFSTTPYKSDKYFTFCADHKNTADMNPPKTAMGMTPSSKPSGSTTGTDLGLEDEKKKAIENLMEKSLKIYIQDEKNTRKYYKDFNNGFFLRYFEDNDSIKLRSVNKKKIKNMFEAFFNTISSVSTDYNSYIDKIKKVIDDVVSYVVYNDKLPKYTDFKIDNNTADSEIIFVNDRTATDDPTTKSKYNEKIAVKYLIYDAMLLILCNPMNLHMYMMHNARVMKKVLYFLNNNAGNVFECEFLKNIEKYCKDGIDAQLGYKHEDIKIDCKCTDGTTLLNYNFNTASEKNYSDSLEDKYFIITYFHLVNIISKKIEENKKYYNDINLSIKKIIKKIPDITQCTALTCTYNVYGKNLSYDKASHPIDRNNIKYKKIEQSQRIFEKEIKIKKEITEKMKNYIEKINKLIKFSEVLKSVHEDDIKALSSVPNKDNFKDLYEKDTPDASGAVTMSKLDDMLTAIDGNIDPAKTSASVGTKMGIDVHNHTIDITTKCARYSRHVHGKDEYEKKDDMCMSYMINKYDPTSTDPSHSSQFDDKYRTLYNDLDMQSDNKDSNDYKMFIHLTEYLNSGVYVLTGKDHKNMFEYATKLCESIDEILKQYNNNKDMFTYSGKKVVTKTITDEINKVKKAYEKVKNACNDNEKKYTELLKKTKTKTKGAKFTDPEAKEFVKYCREMCNIVLGLNDVNKSCGNIISYIQNHTEHVPKIMYIMRDFTGIITDNKFIPNDCGTIVNSVLASRHKLATEFNSFYGMETDSDLIKIALSDLAVIYANDLDIFDKIGYVYNNFVFLTKTGKLYDKLSGASLTKLLNKMFDLSDIIMDVTILRSDGSGAANYAINLFKKFVDDINRMRDNEQFDGYDDDTKKSAKLYLEMLKLTIEDIMIIFKNKINAYIGTITAKIPTGPTTTNPYYILCDCSIQIDDKIPEFIKRAQTMMHLRHINVDMYVAPTYTDIKNVDSMLYCGNYAEYVFAMGIEDGNIVSVSNDDNDDDFDITIDNFDNTITNVSYKSIIRSRNNIEYFEGVDIKNIEMGVKIVVICRIMDPVHYVTSTAPATPTAPTAPVDIINVLYNCVKFIYVFDDANDIQKAKIVLDVDFEYVYRCLDDALVTIPTSAPATATAPVLKPVYKRDYEGMWNVYTKMISKKVDKNDNEVYLKKMFKDNLKKIMNINGLTSTKDIDPIIVYTVSTKKKLP